MRRLVVPVSVLLLLAPTASCHLESAAQEAKARPVSSTELDRMLAPVALYPDSLLSQILMCAGTPAKVSELSAWLASNKSLKGSDLQDAATVAGFGPSFVALALFPQVVSSMAAKLDWTTKLGQAFAADRKGVFASIQRLRAQAQNSGALKDTPQQDVESRTTEAGDTVIVIEPANPQIVYVPQYDPQVVYVQEDNSADAAVAGLIGFTAGIAIGAAMDNNYYYGPYGMYGGFHMYNDAWDDWYDHREDAREDWMDHREDLYEERGERRGDYAEERTERRGDTAEQRTERAENRRESGTASQAQRTERQQNRQETRPATQSRNTTAQTRSAATASNTSRTYGGGTRQGTTVDRSGTRSDAFSGYSSGKSERAASARGSASRQRSGGGGGRRR